jgi:hypothetical protein
MEVDLILLLIINQNLIFQLAKVILKDWMNIDYGKWQAEFHYFFINKKI